MDSISRWLEMWKSCIQLNTNASNLTDLECFPEYAALTSILVLKLWSIFGALFKFFSFAVLTSWTNDFHPKSSKFYSVLQVAIMTLYVAWYSVPSCCLSFVKEVRTIPLMSDIEQTGLWYDPMVYLLSYG